MSAVTVSSWISPARSGFLRRSWCERFPSRRSWNLLSSACPGDEIAVRESLLAQNHLSRLAPDRRGEQRAMGDKGVKLAVLAAGIHARRQIVQQRFVVRSARE